MIPRYSVVVPVFDEVEVLPELVSRLQALFYRLDGPAEAIMVDDGSTDGSGSFLVDLHGRDPRFKVIRFSRNFGHQVAITAGLDAARGDAIVVMDADLQDPPEVVDQLVARWKEGYDVVCAVRADRSSDAFLKRRTASVFYRLLSRLTDVDIPADVGDFRLVDRRVLREFRRLRERNRYVRGMFSWVGFTQAKVPFTRPERAAGSTKYPFAKSLRLGVDGIVSFSHAPLRAALAIGFGVSALSLLFGTAAVALKLAGAGGLVPGWTSVVVVVSLLGGVQLVVMGAMGLYVARIYDEVRARPLYVLQETVGLDADQTASPVAGAVEGPLR